MASVSSAFVTWNNPREIITYEHDKEGNIVFNDDGSKKVLSSIPSFLSELTEQEICDLVLKMWCDSRVGRKGAVTYCISAHGLHHLHMVLQVGNTDSERFTYQSVQKIYGIKFHLEPVKGSKKEALDYINKVGKYAEKGEVVLAKSMYGELADTQGQRTDISGLRDMIMQGKSLNQIFDENINLMRYEKMARKLYFREKQKNTPFSRNIKVYYHVGVEGSGKSLSCKSLIDNIGRDNVFFTRTFDFDTYSGERVLWLDDLKNQLSYDILLSLLDRYTTDVHARYSNIVALWDEVHITSVYAPEQLYYLLVPPDNRSIDTYGQLKRRIHYIVYHFIDNGIMKMFQLPIDEYIDIGTLKRYVIGECDKSGFITLSPDESQVIEGYFSKSNI